MIYFIRIQPDGPIKIGFTDGCPQRRRVMLQTGCPWRLQLLGSIDGCAADEAALHARFASLKMEGEWFSPDATLVSFVEEVLPEAPAPTESIADDWHPLKKYRAQAKLSMSALARRIDVAPPTLYRIESGKRRPGTELAAKISEATGLYFSTLRPDIADIFGYRVADWTERHAQQEVA